jgi:predicted lysophospholipase L1 biosynthesis ABC-type transport system permease subunit
MRLWLKLAVIVGLAAGVQWFMERNMTALDEAALTLRCGDRMLHGENGMTADEIAAADRLQARQTERFLATVAATH